MREYFVWLAKLVTIVCIVFVVVPLLLAGVMTATTSSVVDTSPKKQVAVVELEGIIDSSREVLEELYKYAHSSRVDGIVLRIDSPGGAVAPSQDVFRAVESLKTKKPIVASLGALAASGGYYSAIGASKILAQPGTMTGSIGVVLQVPNFSKVMGTLGVDVITIKSGQLKDAGNTFRPMTDDERIFLESTASTVHEQFLGDVARARAIPLEQVRLFGDGRLILGEDAKKQNLVDGFGTIYDAARMVYDLKGEPLPEGEVPHLVYPADRFNEIKKLLEAAAKIPQIFSTAAPRWELRYQVAG